MGKRKITLGIAFIAGIAVTAMEISASRLLAPYFGTSQLVWTNVIGIVLAALAAGYYLGGRLSEIHPELPALLKIIFIAGVLGLLIPWIARPLAQGFAAVPGGGSPAYVFFGSLLVAAALFGIPIALLGMTSPFLIKIATAGPAGQTAGSISGQIFAWSTIGSILGTFLPTLLLTPWLGTRLTISIFAAVLVVLGSFGFTRIPAKIIAALTVLALFLPLRTPLKPSERLLAEQESRQQFIQVLQGQSGTRYMVVNEGAGIQSIYNPAKTTTGFYYDALALLPRLFPQQKPVKVLIIGVAGGTVPRELAAEYGSGVRLDGVEIDPAVTKLADKYFDFSSVPINMHFADGRIFLAHDPQKYDLIIVDAYQNELYIPFTVTTREFWQSVAGHLNSGGIVALNAGARSPGSPLFLALTNTIASVFPKVEYSPIGANTFNYLITAGRQPLNFATLAGSKNPDLQAMAGTLAANQQNYAFNPAERVLTDDKAPVEFLTEQDLGYLQH